MSRIIDLGDYCVQTKYILSVSKGQSSEFADEEEFYLYIKFRYNDDRLRITYGNKPERDRDYKKIINAWEDGYDKYGD